MMSLPFPILYEDNHLLIINKPSELLTQPNEFDQPSASEYAKEYIKEKYGKIGAVYLHAVHRLDKAASGIVVFARTSKALERLNNFLREKSWGKTYYACVEGNLPQEKGSLEHYLLHGSHKALVVSKEVPHAKLCQLDYCCVAKQGKLCLLEIQLHTGRYHQIRAQLAAIGCPILGDTKYGSNTIFMAGSEAIALHHQKLAFMHPVTKDKLVVEAPWPATWRLLPDNAA